MPRARRAAHGESGPVSRSAILLAHARDRDGARVRAADLDPRRRRERAPFICLGCSEELVPHLGPVRARHFAHRPGSTCPLTAPETALHLDAKERLLELCAGAFAGRRRVVLQIRCPACRRPAPRDLAELGDAAVTEGAVGPRRADVLVLRGGAPALALEVRVAHALEAAKEEALAELGVPAAEIDARGEWEREEGLATAVACARSVGFSPCAACQVAARADEGRGLGGEEAMRAELEAYRARRLMGPPPGRPLEAPPPLSLEERQRIAAAFSCGLCGGRELALGERLVRHACAGEAPRAVAWRGYDGALVELSWWRR
jgi:hypothetical protein